MFISNVGAMFDFNKNTTFVLHVRVQVRSDIKRLANHFGIIFLWVTDGKNIKQISFVSLFQSKFHQWQSYSVSVHLLQKILDIYSGLE